MLALGGLRVKLAVQRGTWGTDSIFAQGPRKTPGIIDRFDLSQNFADDQSVG
jgi:hypothetical protein